MLERLRCNACGQYFTAEVNDEVKADGDSHQKYAYSARSLIALSKYYLGTPFYRQGSLQNILGVPLCASTQFDQMEYLVNDIGPVFNYLKSLAADADFYWIDDTTHRILGEQLNYKQRGEHIDLIAPLPNSLNLPLNSMAWLFVWGGEKIDSLLPRLMGSHFSEH